MKSAPPTVQGKRAAAILNRPTVPLFCSVMAFAVLVVHSAPGSKIEAFSRGLLAAAKPLYTFDHPANAALIQAGARTITLSTDWKSLTARRTP